MEESTKRTLSASLEDNLCTIQQIWASSADLLKTRVQIGGISAALLCCEGMLSTATLAQMVMAPLNDITEQFPTSNALLTYLQKNLLLSTDVQTITQFQELSQMIAAGFAVLLLDNCTQALAIGVQGYASRSIGEPDGEQNIYGAKEGFTEHLRTNLSLIRRRMKSPLLTMQMLNLGSISQTDVCIIWLQDRVSQKLIEKISQKLKKMPLETILSSGYVRPFLEERDAHFFHSVGTTERPDVLCAKLLEGRVAVLIDGTPFSLILPHLFWEYFQTLDDYNESPAYASLIRLLKFAAFTVALMLPAVYLAIAVLHPELLSPTLLQILAKAEQNAPFSLVAEMLGVLFMFEVVREAGLRLPKAVGGAVSIVGGLIIGDAAVNSGLVSTPVLTITVLSVTAGFVIPELHSILTLLRPLLILSAAICGLSGVAVISTGILYNLCAAEVFGYPITAPFAPLFPSRLRDVFVRIGFRRLSTGNFHVSEVQDDSNKQ